MKKSQFTEEHVVAILAEADRGEKTTCLPPGRSGM